MVSQKGFLEGGGFQKVLRKPCWGVQPPSSVDVSIFFCSGEGRGGEARLGESWSLLIRNFVFRANFALQTTLKSLQAFLLTCACLKHANTLSSRSPKQF